MARKLDIPQNTYSSWEDKPERIKGETLEKIAEILQVSREDLVSDLPFVINMNHNSCNGYIRADNFLFDDKSTLAKLCSSLEQQIELLKERVAFLEQENALLKQKD